MNVSQINHQLEKGDIDQVSLFPRLARLKASPYVFAFDFGLKKWNIIEHNLSQKQYTTSAVLISNYY